MLYFGLPCFSDRPVSGSLSEAQNLPFGGVFPESSKLAPFLPLKPSVGMCGCEDSGNHGLEGQNMNFGRVLPRSPTIAPVCIVMPTIFVLNKKSKNENKLCF
jgi:hypothetical protein